ncbi:MAG: hypothetical protein M3O33_09565, partial [Cyanobacteriota bacterium]|nr:hypothetical protein [Cyanobacteriota bacterium]
MAETPNQPREYDAVRGGESSTPVGGVVLGGLEGVKRRFLTSPVVEARVAALSEALKHGDAGLDLVIQARHEAMLVEDAAYRLLLREKKLSSVKQALQDDYLHQLFECFFNIWNTSSVGAVALSPDRQTLASSDWHETIRLWSLQTGQLLHTLEDKDYIKFLAFSLDGQILVSSNMYSVIKLWSVETGDLLHTLQDSNYIEIESIDFGSDGENLIVADARGTTHLWSLQTGQLLQSIDSDEDEEDEYEVEEAAEYEVADNFYDPYI